MVNVMLTMINVLVLVGNLCLLHTYIKLYSEVLKIGHIRNIGKVRGK